MTWNVSGYHNIDRHQGFDAPTTFSVLKDLATFHAVLMAIKDQDPVLYDNNIKPFCSQFYAAAGDMKDQMDRNMLDVFDRLPELRPHLDKITKTIKQSNPFGVRQLREHWTGVMHLDFWCNNIMVTGGKSSRNMILDLQVPMEGSPPGDVIFFLLTSIQLEVIKDKLDDFLHFYFEQFIKNLEEMNVNTSKFTYTGYQKEIETAMKSAEYSHILRHSLFILQDKGLTIFDSSDANFKAEYLADESKKVPPNKRQIDKYRLVTFEALSRGWI